MSVQQDFFLNTFSNKVSVFPWCNSQSGKGRNINHRDSAFLSLEGYDLTGCQLQNSESLNSTPHFLHLRYTKQSLSPPSLFCSMWAPHWTSSQKSALDSQLREKQSPSLVPRAPGLIQTSGLEEEEGNIDWRWWCTCGKSSTIQNAPDRKILCTMTMTCMCLFTRGKLADIHTRTQTHNTLPIQS